MMAKSLVDSETVSHIRTNIPGRVSISGIDEPAFLRRLAECRCRNADRLEAGVLANHRARKHKRDMRGTEELVRDLRAEADIFERAARMIETHGNSR